MIKLVLLRHGQSIWNLENLFSGWTDIDLSQQGVREAGAAADILLNEGFVFDFAFYICLEKSNPNAVDCFGIHGSYVDSHTRIMDVERKTLRRTSRAEQKKHGFQIRCSTGQGLAAWLPGGRSPILWKKMLRQKEDPRYRDLSETPATESLRDTEKRVVAFWHEAIVPCLKQGKKIIITAHGNILRALVKHLDRIDDREIENLNIPTGIPLVYEFNYRLQPQQHYYLGDEKKVGEAIAAVAAQTGRSSAEQ